MIERVEGKFGAYCIKSDDTEGRTEDAEVERVAVSDDLQSVV